MEVSRTFSAASYGCVVLDLLTSPAGGYGGYGQQSGGGGGGWGQQNSRSLECSKRLPSLKLSPCVDGHQNADSAGGYGGYGASTAGTDNTAAQGGWGTSAGGGW